MKPPNSITLNAFTGENLEVSGALASKGNRWGGKGDELAKQAPRPRTRRLARPSGEDKDIGWGVVLTDRETSQPRTKPGGATRRNPSEAHRRPRQCAGSGYRKDLETEARPLLRGRLPPGPRDRPDAFGTGEGTVASVPAHRGPPAESHGGAVSLNRRHHVGRLDLPEEGPDEVRHALLTGGWTRTPRWGGLVWSVNYDADDPETWRLRSPMSSTRR